MQKGKLLYFSIIIVGVIFIARLFYLQVLSNTYISSPLNNSAVKASYIYPERGYVYDRNGVLLIANQSSYDIMVVPQEVKALDTLEFCSLLKITKDDFINELNRAKRYSPRIPSVFLSQVSKDDFAYLQEKMYKYKGFYIQKRLLRKYPIKSAPNVLGYISEVNETMIKKNPAYQLGDLIGTSGIEKKYDAILRGIKGVNFIQRDRFNRELGSYKNGVFDTISRPGNDISLTIDTELQQFGEALMVNKRGGLVAIEPSSGEILALVSTPTYDPNLMVGRDRSKNFTKFYLDKDSKPLFDRGLQAQYAPGSPFKMINGLIGLQEGVIDEQTPFYCHHGFRYGSGKDAFMGCHCGIVGSPIRLNRGIAKSCNSYFSNTYKRIIEKYPTAHEGLDVWSKHVQSFGLGNYLGSDLSVGQKGLIPDANYYDKWYPAKNWKASTIISNAIGQGEILTTPIQLANVAAIIANKGFYYTPHILKKINNEDIRNENFTKPKYTTIESKYFLPIIEGMNEAYKTGTARFYPVEGIELCGKTGTVENFTRIDGEKVQFDDHSIFVAFAPKNNPKIAIAVFVENGGYGSVIAAPITSLMIEKYLKGETKRDWLVQSMYNRSLEEVYNYQSLIKKGIEKKKK